MNTTAFPERKTRTIPEFASAVGIHPKTAYELARQGKLPVPVLRLGRRLAIPAEAIERLLAGEPQPSTSDERAA